uniref:YchJ-like middle NTF2-like domain-containing protein n=1 Tax=Chlamydomonas leiostraca TaxID=1034604 RepID=A0A7S0RI70_9CHLO|mmetsp:Transcript_23364/g.59801  ORF Transcript_23364/g.59801 Transcript_23364/m.59801 type:complete len:220 (+) Transcript_23364:13-672(+)|eukprot:CAMPEP_0202860726 /NCGR_PEP_ID=MMETSP1391-20130828/2345_1 /ASSEMBLY_ACC=CAM_ASM_000867 /TAXON_ID=1034604 /ORGANISM="Chlamydomonas leiostraca, Strain SAG 11-49" /LENGTH=219 /DNA_ID=CAMNT_0049539959 /DNA_START=11 /DNA_END=670 /DNA_ORIENTATION=-
MMLRSTSQLHCSTSSRSAAVQVVPPVLGAPRARTSYAVVPSDQNQRCPARDVTCQAKGFGKPAPKPAGAKIELAPDQPCPCGTGNNYGACCAPYHAGQKAAMTPESLLRSRYTAYALKNAEYIADTTHQDSPEYQGSRPVYLQAVRATQRRAQFKSLTIEKTVPGASADEVVISFRAAWADKERPAIGLIDRVETSTFVREPKTGVWSYMKSDVVKDNK